MAVSMIGPKFYAWDRNGNPLAFGKLYTYQARTNVPKPTYQSEDQVVENTNPVILNGEGYANVYLDGSYKMVLKDTNDNEIWSSDPVTSSQPDEWVNCQSATYVSPTSITIAGNFTDKYDEGRAVRFSDGVDYNYGSIVSSVYASGVTTLIILGDTVPVGVKTICASIIGVKSTNNDTRYIVTFKSDANGSAVDNMIAGMIGGVTSVNHVIGNRYSTGFTTWESKVNGEASSISDFKLISDLHVSEVSDLQSAINESIAISHNSGGGSVFISGDNTVNGKVSLLSNVYLKGINDAKLLLADGVNSTTLQAEGQVNIGIENIEVDSNESNQSLGEYYGVEFKNCQGVSISNLNSHDSVYPNLKIFECENVTGENIILSKSPADGLKITNSKKVSIDNLEASNYPFIETHAVIGAVAAIQIDDGSEEITLNQVRLDAVQMESATAGVDVSSHPGKEITKNIEITNLNTKGFGSGLSIKSSSENVTVTNHNSFEDRISLLLNTCKNVTVNNVNYTSDNSISFTGTRYGIATTGEPEKVTINGGVVNRHGAAVYNDAACTSLKSFKVDSVELTSLDTRSLWARFASTDIVAESYYLNCSFTAGGTASPILLGSNDYADTGFVFELSTINENSSGSTSVTVGIPNVEFLNCKGINSTKSAFDIEPGGSGLVIDGGRYKGGTSGVLALLDAGVEGFKLHSAKVEGYQRVVQGAAGDASTVTKNITLNGNELLNTNSQMIRFAGSVDSVYLDRFTFINNVIDTSEDVFYQKFGVNCTNILSGVNNPDAPLPV